MVVVGEEELADTSNSQKRKEEKETHLSRNLQFHSCFLKHEYPNSVECGGFRRTRKKEEEIFMTKRRKKEDAQNCLLESIPNSSILTHGP